MSIKQFNQGIWDIRATFIRTTLLRRGWYSIYRRFVDRNLIVCNIDPLNSSTCRLHRAPSIECSCCIHKLFTRTNITNTSMTILCTQMYGRLTSVLPKSPKNVSWSAVVTCAVVCMRMRSIPYACRFYVNLCKQMVDRAQRIMNTRERCTHQIPLMMPVTCLVWKCERSWLITYEGW